MTTTMLGSKKSSAQAKTVLIVDDDAAIREMIAFTLTRHGYRAMQAGDVKSAQASMRSNRPDVAIVEWVLPGMSGVDLTRHIKQDRALRHIGVIILTARSGEDDKVLGLESGADDYVTKPFLIRELLARIKALLRSLCGPEVVDVIRADRLVLDRERRRVSAGDVVAPLAPTEFRLLSFLMAHPERVYSRSELLERVWGAQAQVAARTVDVEVSRLREVLGGLECHSYIQTVYGAGYRFSTRTA